MTIPQRGDLVESYFDETYIEVNLFIRETRKGNWEMEFKNLKTNEISKKFHFFFKKEADIAMSAIKKYDQLLKEIK